MRGRAIEITQSAYKSNTKRTGRERELGKVCTPIRARTICQVRVEDTLLSSLPRRSSSRRLSPFHSRPSVQMRVIAPVGATRRDVQINHSVRGRVTRCLLQLSYTPRIYVSYFIQSEPCTVHARYRILNLDYQDQGRGITNTYALREL